MAIQNKYGLRQYFESLNKIIQFDNDSKFRKKNNQVRFGYLNSKNLNVALALFCN